MSADNGIYIGNFNGDYRVICAQAIENCDTGFADITDEITNAYRVCYFGKAQSMNESDAWKEAQRMYNRILQDGDYLEYGISVIDMKGPLPNLTVAEAEKKISDYWDGPNGPTVTKQINERLAALDEIASRLCNIDVEDLTSTELRICKKLEEIHMLKVDKSSGDTVYKLAPASNY